MVLNSASGRRRILVLVAAIFVLAGCGSRNKNEGPPCPDLNVLADAAKFTQFRPGEGHDITDIVLQGEITGYHGTCAYNKDKGLLTMTLQVQMVFSRGPAAQTRDVSTGYFIAVPSFYQKPEAKRVMPVKFTFANAADHIRITDNEVDVILPAKDLEKSIDKLGVYIGFQLDQSELEYNRRAKTQ